MGNNHHHHNQHHLSSMCEKIFGSTFHKNHHNEQDYSAPAAVPIHHHPHPSYEGNSYITQTKPNRAKATSQVVQARQKPNSEYYVPQKENSGGHVEDTDYAFSDYINRAKIKIRAVSNVGGGDLEIGSRVDNVLADRTRQEEDDAVDEFSSYINRAKLGIRKTSSIGSRNMISFKTE